MSASVTVAVTDDDTRAVGFSPAEGLSIDEGGTGTFTAKLSTLPTGTVTVSVTSGDTAAATATPASLTFTTSDWSTAQTVTVKGVQDADGSDESVTISLAASGADYASVSASVTAAVDDDETQAVVVSPASLSIAEGATGTFTAKLSTVPTGDVTVSVTSGDTDAATVSPASLTFTTGNYNTAQTVTVTTVQDADATDEDVTIGLSTIGGGYANVSASVTVAVDDDETASTGTLVVSPTSLTITEGSTGTFTAKLSTVPTGDVTVSVSSGDTGAATASPASLTFTTSNYSTAQTVTVTGVQDADATDESVTISLSASGGGYANVSASAIVTVTDDDSGKPTFGTSTILDKTWVKNASIGTVTLPAATGGNGSLKYSLDGTLPAGVTFNETTRTLAGTPTAKQDATTYTYKATDADGDAATLTFRIRVAKKASDDATFVSYSGVPSKIVAGGKATVTVRMENTGTTTWTSANYKLGSQSPADNTTWGLKRVSLSSDVLPNAIAEFTFRITAPTALGSEKFRWQMLQGVAGWFGAKTTLQTIVVEDPSFGDATVADQAWVKGTPIASVTLPAASGGAGALTYALTPALPAGVTFTAATRVLAGTPTESKTSTWYTYTATDTAGDKATISFRIKATEAPRDDAAFVSYSGVPSKIAADGTATVTVTMRNTGTTTWTSAAGYKLGSQSPADNTTWGLSRVAVPSDTAPNETADFAFTITAPGTTGGHAFAWRMVRDAATWFGASTTSSTVTVEDPSFGDATVSAQAWAQNKAVTTTTLPAASGGAGALTYALTPALPAGVTFAASTRTLSGTPTGSQTATTYTYTATDTGGHKATLTFGIRVEAAPTDNAAFVSSSGVPAKMAAGGTATVTVTMRNTGTTTWTSAAGYKLGSQSPADNTTWGSSRVSLASDVAPNGEVSFSISVTAPSSKGGHTFAWRMVRDPGTWFGAATTSATITVEDPSFGSASVANQSWSPGVAITSLTLPAASGGDGRLTYSLTPAPPAGVTFTAATRTLSGTPRSVQDAATYTYAATDRDGDKATLTFSIAVGGASAWSEASMALPPSPPSDADAERAQNVEGGVFDAFEYWLLPPGSAVKVRTRLGDGREAPAAGSAWLRSFWRGDLWGRKVALLGDPDGGRYDIFEEVADGLDYWGTYEGVSSGGEARPSVSLDRPFRWMNRFMAVGDAVEGPVTGRLLSDRRRNQDGVIEATMRLEVLSHRASFTIPGAPSGALGVSGVSGASGAPGDPGAAGPTFEDVLEVRFWPDIRQAEVHDTFYLARGYGAVYSRRSGVSAPDEVAEWWAVEKALTPVAPAAPSVPWFDPFSGAWPKTAVLNGNLDDVGPGFEGGPVGRSALPESSWLPETSGTPGTSRTSRTSGTFGAPGWRADSGDATVARPPAGLDAGPWGLLLRGSAGGGDDAPDAAVSEEWIPVDGGTYRLSACMLRENARDDVFVDFDDGRGRDADFGDAHLVAASTGTWECRAVTKCIPASVGAVKVRAARGGANLGDAWFDRIELKRIAACAERPAFAPPSGTDAAASPGEAN